MPTTATSDASGALSRRLRNATEPLAANVYFAKAAHDRYEAMGLDYFSGYFCSRSAGMGRLAGETVAATFGVFNPAAVIPAVEKGWSLTDPESMLEARRLGATEELTRILSEANDGALPDGIERATELLKQAGEGTTPNGHAIHAGLRSQGWPGDPVGDLWRAADLVREFRGDTHNAAWVAGGVDAVEITLLTERWWGIGLNSYCWTRGWSQEEIDDAIARLRDRGLLDGDDLTDAGRAVREGIEEATDAGDRPVLEALGDDVDELIGLLRPWARAVVESGGYPMDPSDLGTANQR
jgi:hypothetical protein